MDESKLLDECVVLNITPLQTLLLSETVIIVNNLIRFLVNNNLMGIEKITNDKFTAPAFEQTGNILINSAVNILQEVRIKIWENGKKEIGDIIPKEFEEIVAVYATVLEEIAYKFINMIAERER